MIALLKSFQSLVVAPSARPLRLALSAFLSVALSFAISTPSFAQSPNDAPPPVGGPRKQLATILYAGLGGAVLGLSTLSFYGRPQDKLSNIAIGFAVGIMAGTAIVTYGAATNPDEFYGTPSSQGRLQPQFSPPENRFDEQRLATNAEAIGLSWNFDF
jgi:hypothetical protein